MGASLVSVLAYIFKFQVSFANKKLKLLIFSFVRRWEASRRLLFVSHKVSPRISVVFALLPVL